jgi:ATP-binding cassette subfamily B protein
MNPNNKSNRPHGPMGAGPQILVEKPKHFKKTLTSLGQSLKPYRLSIFLTVFFAVSSTIFAIASPKILGNMTNQIFEDFISIKTYDEVMKHLPTNTKLSAGTTGEQLINQMPTETINQIPADQLDKIKTLDLSKKPVIHYDVLGNTALILIAL